jgi:hypothetical protein
MSEKTSKKRPGSDDVAIYLDRSLQAPNYTAEGLKKFIASQGNKPKV